MLCGFFLLSATITTKLINQLLRENQSLVSLSAEVAWDWWSHRDPGHRKHQNNISSIPIRQISSSVSIPKHGLIWSTHGDIINIRPTW